MCRGKRPAAKDFTLSSQMQQVGRRFLGSVPRSLLIWSLPREVCESKFYHPGFHADGRSQGPPAPSLTALPKAGREACHSSGCAYSRLSPQWVLTAVSRARRDHWLQLSRCLAVRMSFLSVTQVSPRRLIPYAVLACTGKHMCSWNKAGPNHLPRWVREASKYPEECRGESGRYHLEPPWLTCLHGVT